MCNRDDNLNLNINVVDTEYDLTFLRSDFTSYG